jgi:hypothetical protein
MGRHASFYSCHFLCLLFVLLAGRDCSAVRLLRRLPATATATVPLAIRQKILDDIVAVGLEQNQALTRSALHVLGTAAHKMSAVGCARLDVAGARDAEALFRPAVGLHFGHFHFLIKELAAGHVQKPRLAKEGLIRQDRGKSKGLLGHKNFTRFFKRVFLINYKLFEGMKVKTRWIQTPGYNIKKPPKYII